MNQQPRLNLPIFRDATIPREVSKAFSTLRDWGRYTDDSIADLLLTRSAWCQMAMSTAQAGILDTTNTPLVFDTVRYDPYNWWTALQPTQIKPTFPGWYRVTFATDWSVDADYTRLVVYILKNGAQLTPTYSDERAGIATALTPNQLASSPFIEMDGINDYLSLLVLQANTSTGAASCNAVFQVEYHMSSVVLTD